MPCSHSSGRQVHLAGEGVQVAHRGVADFLQARIFGAGHLAQRFVGDGEFVQVLHGRGLPFDVLWSTRRSIAVGNATAGLCQIGGALP